MAEYIRWLRNCVGPHLIPVVYASAVIRDGAGRILFQHRADFGEAWWGLPGGVLEPGETAEACAVREVLEETGLRVEPLRLTGVYSSPRYRVTYPNGDQVQQVTLCFECRIVGGELRSDGREIKELQFIAPGALPPRPVWYADMADHALDPDRRRPHFDPPEYAELPTPFPTLMSVRRVVGTAPLIWAGAHAIVRDEGGRILLGRRGDTGTWALPAGSLDAGETLAQTAIREVHEETGLWVRPLWLAGTYSGYEVSYPNGDRVFPVGVTFVCQPVGGELHADGHETLELRFFDPGDLPPLPPWYRSHLLAAMPATDHSQSF